MIERALRPLGLVAAAWMHIACGGEAFQAPDDEDPPDPPVPPADVAGQYLISVTNGANDCEVDSWEAGTQSTGIAVTFTQDADAISAVVGGLTGAYFLAVTGTNALAGTVDGQSITLQTIGTVELTSGLCTFTMNTHAEGTAEGDAIQGKFRYEPETNGHADCGALNACANEQMFSGSRPPAPEGAPD